MKKQRNIPILFVLIINFCVLSNCFSLAYSQDTAILNEIKPGFKYRIAVVDFEDKTKYGQARLGSAISDILTTELAKSDIFIIVEREKLQRVFEEQKLQQSGLIQDESVVALGQILGLNALITGSVSQFGMKVEGENALFVQTKRQIAEAVVDIRVIDAQTGKVLYADSGKGTAKKESGSFLGMGSSAGYDETLGGKALREAILKFVNNIVLKISNERWFCTIAELEGNNIYLDAGIESGLEIGTCLEVYHTGKEVRSASGELIGKIEEKIGTIKIVKYFGNNGSIAEIESGSISYKGDICRIAEK